MDMPNILNLLGYPNKFNIFKEKDNNSVYFYNNNMKSDYYDLNNSNYNNLINKVYYFLFNYNCNLNINKNNELFYSTCSKISANIALELRKSLSLKQKRSAYFYDILTDNLHF